MLLTRGHSAQASTCTSPVPARSSSTMRSSSSTGECTTIQMAGYRLRPRAPEPHRRKRNGLRAQRSRVTYRCLEGASGVSRRQGSSSGDLGAAGSYGPGSCRSRCTACTRTSPRPCVPTDGRVATARNSASGIASQHYSRSEGNTNTSFQPASVVPERASVPHRPQAVIEPATSVVVSQGCPPRTRQARRRTHLIG